jgi:hypothetical protein
MYNTDDFDYLPEDPWPGGGAYPGGRQPMAGQSAYPPAYANGTRTGLSDDRAAMGYPPPDGRTRTYQRGDSGPFAACGLLAGGPARGYQPVPVLSLALVVSAAAALAGGGALAKLTGKPILLGGLRQFTAAALATGMAFAIGHLISGHVM